MRAIDRLAQSDALIYVAGRLFSLEDKIHSEWLEQAVLAGVAEAVELTNISLTRPTTYVPFRDAGQEELVASDKAQRLFELDLERLERTALLVSNVDGLAKDEGVCFEIGYSFAVGAKILLISTDFTSLELPCGDEVPFEPLLSYAADYTIRRPQLLEVKGPFLDVLLATRSEVLQAVREAVSKLLVSAPSQRRARNSAPRSQSGAIDVLVEMGGGVFEWQRTLYETLDHAVGRSGRAQLHATARYEAAAADIGAREDLDALATADLLVTCTDSDEAPAGTALLQGAARALGLPVWMYNSKRTAIRAAGGYRSSRNLMLDYSATRTFASLHSLAEELRSL